MTPEQTVTVALHEARHQVREPTSACTIRQAQFRHRNWSFTTVHCKVVVLLSVTGI